MFNIDSRFRAVIEAKAKKERRWKELEFNTEIESIDRSNINIEFEEIAEATSISARTWRNTFEARQRPTGQLIEALCRVYPQYAFWLTTGITDVDNGHVAPIGIITYPEENKTEQRNTTAYFHQQLWMLATHYAVRFMFLPDSIVAKMDNWFAKANMRISGQIHPTTEKRIQEREQAALFLAEIKKTRAAEIIEISNLEGK